MEVFQPKYAPYKRGWTTFLVCYCRSPAILGSDNNSASILHLKKSVAMIGLQTTSHLFLLRALYASSMPSANNQSMNHTSTLLAHKVNPHQPSSNQVCMPLAFLSKSGIFSAGMVLPTCKGSIGLEKLPVAPISVPGTERTAAKLLCQHGLLSIAKISS